jgi:two-component system, OmpR family, sensor histidine kinase KdpD
MDSALTGGGHVPSGELRTYLGIAPGVGKTYAMLRDGRAQRRAGLDVVVAYWERHGRPSTAAQVRGLEVLPTRTVCYRSASFQELDVEAVLRRRPQLALVDELAHALLPGQRHSKRWQDVEEILSHGIGVYTTLNVSNVQSLRKLVAKITGAPPAEPVPDSLVRTGQVELVDLAPAALRRRLSQGLVFFPTDRTDTALSGYFRYANLAALRELAQLWLDQSVADPVKAYRAAHHMPEQPPTGPVMVGLDGSARDEWLIRYAADLAQLNNTQLTGVHVRLFEASARRAPPQLTGDRRLLQNLHGSLIDVKAANIPTGLVQTARRHHASQLVIGSPAGSRWSRWLKGFTVRGVTRAAGDLPVQVVNVGNPKTGLPVSHAQARPKQNGRSKPTLP